FSPARASLVEQLTGLAAARGDQAAFGKALSRITTPSDGKYAAWQFSAMAGLLDALDRLRTSLKKLQDEGKADLKGLNVESIFTAARARSSDARAPMSERVDAVRLLGRGPTDREKDLGRLGELLRPEVPSALQEASLAALQR